MKRNIKFIIILVLCIFLLVWIEISRPRPIDWTEGYSGIQKKPYGSYIIFDILDDLFPYSEIHISDLPIYNTILDLNIEENLTYFFINDAFELNKYDAEKLLEFVAKGNSAFISANNYNGIFADSIRIKTDFKISYTDTVAINFVNPALKSEENFRLKPNEAPFYFSEFDTVNSTVLGVNNFGGINFIQLKFGKGLFYLSTVPIVYTNYYLLHMDLADYIAGSLSYLSPGNIIWDEYYKHNKKLIKTPLRFILSSETLSWAYYLLILLFSFLFVFKSKRQQRIIPVIDPIKNSTLEFISIIGKLYFQTKNHKLIAEKRIKYLLDYIRTKYFLKTTELDEYFVEQLSGKSGVPKTFLNMLFESVNHIRNKNTISQNELTVINHNIDQFYNRVGN